MPREKTQVTVLMAVYNGSSFLRIAIDSILDQTYADLEFLIVDDASTDDTLSIIESYDDDRIEVIPLTTNVGQTQALNIGLRAVKTPWVARMDADDFSAPSRLEEQMKVLENNPDISCLGTYAWYFRSDPLNKYGDVGTPLNHICIKHALLSGSPLIHGTIVIKRDSLLSVGGYDGRYRYAADLEMYDRFLEMYQVAAIPLYLLGIRRYPEQGSRTRVALDEVIGIFTGRLLNNNYSAEDIAIIKKSLSKVYLSRSQKFIASANWLNAGQDVLSSFNISRLAFWGNVVNVFLITPIPEELRILLKNMLYRIQKVLCRS